MSKFLLTLALALGVLTGGQVAPGGPVRATFGASRSSPTLRAVLR